MLVIFQSDLGPELTIRTPHTDLRWSNYDTGPPSSTLSLLLPLFAYGVRDIRNGICIQSNRGQLPSLARQQSKHYGIPHSLSHSLTHSCCFIRPLQLRDALLKSILLETYFWFNWMPLSRGSAAVGTQSQSSPSSPPGLILSLRHSAARLCVAARPCADNGSFHSLLSVEPTAAARCYCDGCSTTGLRHSGAARRHAARLGGNSVDA